MTKKSKSAPKDRYGRPFNPADVDVRSSCYDGRGHDWRRENRYGLDGLACHAGCGLFHSVRALIVVA